MASSSGDHAHHSLTLGPAEPVQFRDPVCGMPVKADSLFRASRQGQAQLFCSQRGRDKFLAQPEQPEPSARAPGRMRNMRQNLAFLYNALGIPLAAGLLYPLTGHLLSPMIAALAMSLSSASVVFNALRLRKADLD